MGISRAAVAVGASCKKSASLGRNRMKLCPVVDGSQLENEMHSNIALFAYKRPLHVKQVVEFLHNKSVAAESSRTVFADGARGGSDQAAVQEVRSMISKP